MRSQIPPKKFLNSFRVLYGYKDIHGIFLGREVLAKKLEELPAWAVIDTLSKLSILMANSATVSNESLTSTLIQTFLRPDSVKKLSQQVRTRNNREFLLFSDRSLCLLVEFSRRYCKAEESGETNQKYFHTFGDCILIANDLANGASLEGKLIDESLPQEEQIRTAKEKYTTFSTREYLFNTNDQFRYVLARSNLIYSMLNDNVPDAFKFDLSSKLETQLGFSLKDYLLTLLCIWSYWANQSLNWETKHTNIDPKIIFPEGPQKEKFLKVLGHLSQDFFSKEEIPAENIKFQEWQYQYFGLRSRPLLRYKERLFAGSMKFIMELFWQGPYFLVLDNFEKQDREKFLHYLGHSTEYYVIALLKDCIGKKVKFPTTASGIPIGECLIKMRANWSVVIEVKAGRADTTLQSKAIDPTKIKKTDQMLYDGLKQLSARISDMRKDGCTGRITPILITGGSFPIDTVAWDHHFEKIKDFSLFQDSNTDFPQVMDVRTFETLCSMLKTGCRFGEILTEKIKSNWVKEDMISFLSDRWRTPRFKHTPTHPALWALNTEIYNDLMKGLGLTGEKFEVNADWRQVFSIKAK